MPGFLGTGPYLARYRTEVLRRRGCGVLVRGLAHQLARFLLRRMVTE